MTELPQNWIEAPLGKLLKLICNGISKKQNKDKNGIPVTRIETIANSKIDLSRIGYIENLSETEIEQYKLQVGDILFSNINSDKHLGKTAIFELDMLLLHGMNLLLIRLKDNINFKYVNYYFQYCRFLGLFINIAHHAVNQSSINQTNLKNFPIILPPENEQKRIVEKLDKMMRIIDGVNARLDKIPTALKRARQSILNQAITGELTKDWREKNLDIIPASIMIEQFKQLLLESSSKNERDNINNIFTYKENYFSFDIPHTWTFSILEKLCKSFKYGTSTKSESSGLVPVLRMGNIQKGEIDWNDLVYTSDSKEIEKYKLEKNDVLFNRTNSPELVGKTAIYRGERAVIYAGYLIKIENYKILNSEYLNYALNSTFAKEWKLDVKTDGVSQSNINAQKLAKFEVPLPPLEEQAEIVRRVKLAFEKLDKIESRYQKAKEYSDKLTQSILNKAFRGELVPQDPNDKPVEIKKQI